MTYREALAFLASLESLGIRPGLDRIEALLARLGNPHRTFPSVLIGGTNGKGSVSAYLASILGEAGVPAGVYTSPHLIRFEERIAIGGTVIGEDEIAALGAEVREAIEGGRGAREDLPTYFEATTALAFLHFSRRRVPLAVLEVGMGGRFDATNVVTPLACAITPVALDHTQWLGGTLREIALQKAGILKPDVPGVVAPQDPAVLEAIVAEARRVGAPLARVSDTEVTPAGPGGRLPDPPVFSLTTPSGGRYDALTLSLRGAHQVTNATTAILLAEKMAARGFPSIDRGAVSRGLARAVWPGRLELIAGDRHGGPAGRPAPDLLLDGAHNPAGCESLAAYLSDHQAGRGTALVFAAMRDKPAGAMLSILAPYCQDLIVTALPVARGESPEVLLELAASRHPRARMAREVGAALGLAREAAGDGGLVVVAGSLYLVGEAKKLPGAAGSLDRPPGARA